MQSFAHGTRGFNQRQTGVHTDGPSFRTDQCSQAPHVETQSTTKVRGNRSALRVHPLKHGVFVLLKRGKGVHVCETTRQLVYAGRVHIAEPSCQRSFGTRI